jgi:hypothetical protein
MNLRNLAAIVALLIGLGAVVGCGDDSVTPTNDLAPFEPEIVSNASSFELQATGVSNVTATQEYGWQNTGTAANINQAGSVVSGMAVLTILDAASVTVYSRNLSETGTFGTGSGTQGMWTIQLALSNCGGALNFRVETP